MCQLACDLLTSCNPNESSIGGSYKNSLVIPGTRKDVIRELMYVPTSSIVLLE